MRSYLLAALRAGDLVSVDLSKWQGDHIYIWGNGPWPGSYLRTDFISEKEAKEKYPEAFI